MKRIYRKAISLFAIVALLFTQIAVSAYACPMLTHADSEQDAAVSTSISSADEIDVAQPGLCQKHGENGPPEIASGQP